MDQGDGSEVIFNSDEQNYPYLHVSQGDVKKFSEQPEELSSEIKRMLGISVFNFNQVIADEITENIGKYRSFVEYWKLSDHSSNRINTPDYQNNIITQQAQLIQTLTSPQNKQLIEQYQNNVQLINVKQSAINELRKVQGVISRYLTEINHSIRVLNQNASVLDKILLIGGDDSDRNISNNVVRLENEIQGLTKNNAIIVTSFQQQGINQDISSLLSKVTESQSVIDAAEAKLIEIGQRTKDYQTYVQRRCKVIGNYQIYLLKQKQGIDVAFSRLKQPQQQWNEEQNKLVAEILNDIDIQGSVFFDVNRFYDGIQGCVNLGKFKPTKTLTTVQRLINTFKVSTIEDFFNLVSGQEIINCEDGSTSITLEDFFWKSEYFNQEGKSALTISSTVCRSLSALINSGPMSRSSFRLALSFRVEQLSSAASMDIPHL